MRKVFALAPLALAFALTTTARAQQPTPAPQASPQTQAHPPSSASPQPTPAPAESHEYAPIQERGLDYKDWTYKSAASGDPVNLRGWARGRRLVLVVYFAPWCHNWKAEASVVARLYQKFHDAGLDIIAVSEYGTPAEIKSYFDAFPAAYPVVVESDSEGEREKTTHYDYRRKTGDARKWGSPYNVFLDPARLNAAGDVLASKVWVANGELVEAEAEKFIRERLGLPAGARIED
ncbi:MAG: TlpA family protein disulfide reductase [Acidobacteria bacterium]|nr:TlpA family protein disulfide reductase [Acidobacteriota bacterium]